MDTLPYDIIELIYKKVHILYMKDLEDEIYDAWYDYDYRINNNLGDDFDEDYEPSEEEEDTDYSYVESD
jgi:hypothetical protein